MANPMPDVPPVIMHVRLDNRLEVVNWGDGLLLGMEYARGVESGR